MDKRFRGKLFFALVAGILYTTFGIVQAANSLGLTGSSSDLLFIPEDIMGSLILILIGIIFLAGVYETHGGKPQGVSFIYFGILFSLLFALIYMLIMVADAIEAYVVMSEVFSGWTPLDDVKPGIYLSILSLLGALAWRKKLSLTGLSRAGI